MKIIISLLLIMFSFSIHADEIYQESAVEVCQQLKQKSYIKKCMAQVKKATFNETALTYCANVGSWNKIKSCLDLIKNNQYQAQPLALCHSAKYYNNEFKSCLNEIVNKSYVSKIELGLCKQETTFKKQIKCLKTSSSKPYEEIVKETKNNDQLLLAKLKIDIKKAYELLRENKTADATILLHDVVNSLEK
ncbi:MAG: hypothetical protein JKY50_08415 [Oleispira sp.]|nr:hypothetical protein [Oleispira sp.]MBL4880042.1 hypothetical protein [Oleispira sp.]